MVADLAWEWQGGFAARVCQVKRDGFGL